MRTVNKRFTFMESYFWSIDQIKDPEKKLQFLLSVIRYGLFEEDPSFDSDMERAFFEEIRSHIDLSHQISERRSEAGKKGGQANSSKSKQKQANSSKSKQSEANRIEKNRKEKEENKNGNEIYKDLPSDLVDSLMNFEEMRKKIKKPLTDKAREQIIKKLFEYSSGNVDHMIAILNQSIVNCWAFVYPLKQIQEKNLSPLDIVELGRRMQEAEDQKGDFPF